MFSVNAEKNDLKPKREVRCLNDGPATRQAIAERKFYDWREVDNNGEYNKQMCLMFSNIFI